MGHINRPVIPFYTVRSFSDKLSATTEFITAHWRTLLRYITMLLLPVCILSAAYINKVYGIVMLEATGNMSSSDIIGIIANYLLLIVFYTVGSLLMASVVFAVMRLHHHMTSPDSPDQYAAIDGEATPAPASIGWAQLRPLITAQTVPLLKALAASIIYGIAVIAAVVMLGTLCFSTGSMGLLFGLLLVVFLICAMPVGMMLLPVFEFDNPGIFSGIMSAARYGLRTMGGILGVVFVVSIAIQIIVSVFAIPLYAMNIMKMLFLTDSYDALAFTSAPWFEILKYVMTVISMLAWYLLYSVLIVAMAYQYGHAKEKIDGTADNNFNEPQKPDMQNTLTGEFDNF